MEVITVGIGDCRVSSDPDSILVTHALGSCIAVAIHDPVAKVAGLLHFMLPESALDPERARRQPYLFADTGIPDLFHAAYAQGAEKKRMTVRLIGGAQVMDPDGFFNIGKRNYLACRKILRLAGVAIDNEACGGTISRTVRMDVSTGALWCNSGGSEPQPLAVGKKDN